MLAQPAHARLCRSGMGTVIRVVAGIRMRMGKEIGKQQAESRISEELPRRFARQEWLQCVHS